MKDESAGLLAAAFIGIAPGYISRSVAGSYDNEAIAIFLLMFTFFCWIKALKTGSVLFGTLTALFCSAAPSQDTSNTQRGPLTDKASTVIFSV